MLRILFMVTLNIVEVFRLHLSVAIVRRLPEMFL